MTNPNTRLRSSGLVSIDELKTPITMIGAGSIGSFTALYLAKMGCENINVWDFDKVSEVNVGCQLYGIEHIGRFKTQCLQATILHLTGVEIVPHETRWGGVVSPILISCVDSMNTRREIWETIKHNGGIDWYIDGRMAGEYLHIYTIKMGDTKAMTEYTKSLQGKDQEHISCSERSVVYNTSIVGGLIAKQIKSIAKKQTLPREIIFDLATLQLVTF
jgi:molybdopterin/thiamine biosynthesis adenylyltransferase